jgi:tetratricopeptide (TPR) repeat protein
MRQDLLSTIARVHFQNRSKRWQSGHYTLSAMTLMAIASLLQPSTNAFAASQAVYDGCNQSSDLDRRIAACTQIINGRGETTQNRGIAYSQRGIAYYDKGDYDRAVADYTEAIQFDPKRVSTYYNRGLAYQDKGDYDRALADYGDAIRLDPKDTDAYKKRCNAAIQLGNYNAAVADCSRGGWVLSDQIVGTWNNVSTGENMTVRHATGESEKLTIEASLSGGSYSCSYFLTMINDVQMNLKLTDGDQETCLRGIFMKVRLPKQEWGARIIGTWNNISTSRNIVIQGVSGATENEWDNVKLTGSLLGAGVDLNECLYHLTMLNETQVNLQLRSGPDACLHGVFIRVGTR